MSDTQHTRDDRHRAKVFDIRIFIAALIGVSGVVLVLTGLFGTNEGDLAMAGGVNVNLLAGLGMLVFSGCFMAWARVRPVLVPERPEEHADPETAEVN
jgi:drug/metabolite transporter (DMT)-like permease